MTRSEGWRFGRPVTAPAAEGGEERYGNAVGALIKRPRMRSIHRLRQQTIQAGSISKARWICLRQIAFVPNAGRLTLKG